MTLQSGSLNRLVTIQRKSGDKDGLGQSTPAWVDFALVWANVRMLSGKEYMAGQVEVSKAIASIRIRYREDITAEMRVIYRGAIYNIAAVLPDAQGREYVDLAVSIGANRG
jgi:SPP1 family predicted phage head-tail adaptor